VSGAAVYAACLLAWRAAEHRGGRRIDATPHVPRSFSRRPATTLALQHGATACKLHAATHCESLWRPLPSAGPIVKCCEFYSITSQLHARLVREPY